MEQSNQSTITLPVNQQRTHVAHLRLRAVAPQAKFVAETYADSHPAIAVQAPGVIQVSAAFIIAYDKSRTKAPDAAQESKELRQVTLDVHRNMQAWMGALVTAAPQIDLSSFANAGRSPKGIIADAQRLIELVGKHVQDGEPIPFADQMLVELQAGVEVATKELEDVLKIEAEHAQLEQRVRELGIELNAKLVGLRKTVRVVLGRTHPHYRALLIRKRAGSGALELAVDEDAVERPATLEEVGEVG